MHASKILVVGSTGQVGRELTRAAWPESFAVTALSRQDLDVTDRAAVTEAIMGLRPSVVVNATAYTAVDKAESDAETAFAVNAAAPAYLAEAAERIGAPIIHLSTDYVFDGSKVDGYVEEDPVNPLGVYGRSKEDGERAVRTATARHVILRTAWVYSPFGSNFVKTMLRLGRERSELRVVADQRGCPTSAGEIARAIVEITQQLLEPGNEAQWGTYHLAGAGEATWHEFAETIFDLAAPVFGQRPTVRAITTAEYPTPTRRPVNSVLLCDKVERAYGVSLRPWREALSSVVDSLTQSN